MLTYATPDADNPRNHESVTRRHLAQRLANLKGYAFGGEYDASAAYVGHRYFVPADTIVGRDTASRLGIHGEDDLFGAVVPHGFMTTKTISHGRVHPAAAAPTGWSDAFGEHVREAVLRGFTAFTRDDARHAARLMLLDGAARVKRARGIGGQDQFVIDALDDLDGVLDGIDGDELATCGVVIEENLVDVVTHSVGQVRVGALIASYCGTQRLTPNNRGVNVYGGSSLLVVRGDFDVLMELPLDAATQRAIAHARLYDDGALRHFSGMFASRRNYDIASGTDARGRPRCGVLEQSWRIGGASGAEIGALEAFQADVTVTVVRATSTEIFGPCDPPPAHAVVYFRDTDERAGMLTKFSVVEPYAHTR